MAFHAHERAALCYVGLYVGVCTHYLGNSAVRQSVWVFVYVYRGTCVCAHTPSGMIKGIKNTAATFVILPLVGNGSINSGVYGRSLND